jgi:hypothetical protein
MNRWRVFLCLSLMLLPVEAAGTKKTDFTVPVKYEGGTLPLSQGKTRATISADGVVLSHRNQTFSIPIQNITRISCSTQVRRRSGATVLGVVPRLHLDTTEEHFIGLTLEADHQQTSRIEAVLKMNGGQYREFLTTLERLTGRRAVNTSKTPTVVQYGL